MSEGADAEDPPASQDGEQQSIASRSVLPGGRRHQASSGIIRPTAFIVERESDGTYAEFVADGTPTSDSESDDGYTGLLPVCCSHPSSQWSENARCSIQLRRISSARL